MFSGISGLSQVLAQRHKLRPLQGLAAAVITVGCVTYLALSSDFPSLAAAARRANYGLLGLALLLSILTIVCKAVRWQVLYPANRRPGLGLAVVSLAVGQVANWAAPARLGDMARIGLSSPEVSSSVKLRHGVALGAGVLVAEKLTDGAMLLSAVALLSTVGGLPIWVNAIGLVSVGLVCVAGVITVLILKNPSSGDWIVRRLRWLAQHRMTTRYRGLASYLSSMKEGLVTWLRPTVVGQALAWSLGAWMLGGAINYVVLESLGLSYGLGPVLAVLVAGYGGAVLPSLPGRVGVFQYMCVLALSPFGVGFDDALAFSVALYAVVYLPPIVIGLVSVAPAGSSVIRLARSRMRQREVVGKEQT